VTKQRILDVDDERNMRTTLADILADEGFEVSTAESGEKAVKICKHQLFDAVLMDVRMPGIDGIEAFRRIRRQGHKARVIMMSAYSVEHLIEETLEEGVVAFLRKPLDAAQLLELLDDA
jgi:two-component system response regulator HydG